MRRLAYLTAICATTLVVGPASADTYNPFTVHATFTDPFRDIFSLTGSVDVDVTSGTFAKASFNLVGEPWTNIVSQGSAGRFYDLNIQTPVFNAGCSASNGTGSSCHDTLSLVFLGSPLLFATDQGGSILGGFADLRDAGFDVALLSGSLVSSTPIPATLPLFAAGLGVIGFLARHRRNRLASTNAR
jgi:hypothetical protein